MNKAFYKHKRNDCIKWIAVFLAIILLALGVAAALTQGFKSANAYCWLGHDYDENGICTRCGAEKLDENGVDDEISVKGGGIATVLPSNGIQLLATKMTPVSGVPISVVENTWELTATVDKYADNKLVDWTVEFVNPSSEWAIGKTVTDYVTVTPISDGALTATVTVLKDFGEQIKVVCSARDTTLGTISAECLFDYVKKIVSLNINMPSVDKTSTFTFDAECTDYTVDSEVVFSVFDDFVPNGRGYVYMTVNPDFKTAFNSAMCDEVISLGKSVENYKYSNLPNLTYYLAPGVHVGLVNSEWCVTLYEPTLPTPSAPVSTYDDNELLSYFFAYTPYGFSSGSWLPDDTRLVAFRKVIPTTPVGSFTVYYRAVYDGHIYSRGSVNVDIKLDGSSIFVPIHDVTLNESHIYV